MKSKKILSLVLLVVLLIVFAGGCAGKSSSQSSEGNSDDKKGNGKITLADYEVSGVQNVEYVEYLYIGEVDGTFVAKSVSPEEGNYIAVGTVCPHCNNKQEYRKLISIISEAEIGKSVITKTDIGECGGSDHSSADPDEYMYSYVFNLIN